MEKTYPTAHAQGVSQANMVQITIQHGRNRTNVATWQHGMAILSVLTMTSAEKITLCLALGAQELVKGIVK